jgi:hypothetical protein
MEISNQIINILNNDKKLENNSGLQLSKIDVNPDYRKKWNIHQSDFFCLTKDGELLRPTLYRIGGLNDPKVGVDRYFMLLKHVEAFYPERILKMSSNFNKGKKQDPKHLASRWCILDEFGNEKVEFEGGLHYPYLVKNSCIYSIDRNYYNIETGLLYCNSNGVVSSRDFLFLENNDDKDKQRRGVMKINKLDGTFELFPEK